MKKWLRHKALQQLRVVSGYTLIRFIPKLCTTIGDPAAQAGNTDAIRIDNGADLKDGTYSLEEKGTIQMAAV